MSDQKCPLLVDVHVPKAISEELRALGYSVTTVQQHQGTSRPETPLSDLQIVEIGAEHRCAVVTQDAGDFRRIHLIKPDHKGIIICAVTDKYAKMAKEIDRRIKEEGVLYGKLIEVSLD